MTSSADGPPRVPFTQAGGAGRPPGEPKVEEEKEEVEEMEGKEEEEEVEGSEELCAQT